MKPVIAAFDFDKTITTRDTVLPFLLSVNPYPKKALNILKLLPTALRYQLGQIPNHQAKQKILTAFLADYSLATLAAQANKFAQQFLPRYIRPEALHRIHWHHAQGHRCILVSAGLELYLKPWAATLPFETILATQLVVHNNLITGQIAGLNCFGAEKMHRLLKYAGERNSFVLYAYGDSRGDQELLESADYAYYRHFPND